MLWQSKRLKEETETETEKRVLKEREREVREIESQTEGKNSLEQIGFKNDITVKKDSQMREHVFMNLRGKIELNRLIWPIKIMNMHVLIEINAL